MQHEDPDEGEHQEGPADHSGHLDVYHRDDTEEEGEPDTRRFEDYLQLCYSGAYSSEEHPCSDESLWTDRQGQQTCPNPLEQDPVSPSSISAPEGFISTSCDPTGSYSVSSEAASRTPSSYRTTTTTSSGYPQSPAPRDTRSSWSVEGEPQRWRAPAPPECEDEDHDDSAADREVALVFSEDVGGHGHGLHLHPGCHCPCCNDRPRSRADIDAEDDEVGRLLSGGLGQVNGASASSSFPCSQSHSQSPRDSLASPSASPSGPGPCLDTLEECSEVLRTDSVPVRTDFGLEDYCYETLADATDCDEDWVVPVTWCTWSREGSVPAAPVTSSPAVVMGDATSPSAASAADQARARIASYKAERRRQLEAQFGPRTPDTRGAAATSATSSDEGSGAPRRLPASRTSAAARRAGQRRAAPALTSTGTPGDSAGLSSSSSSPAPAVRTTRASRLRAAHGAASPASGKCPFPFPPPRARPAPVRYGEPPRRNGHADTPGLFDKTARHAGPGGLNCRHVGLAGSGPRTAARGLA